MTLRIRFPLFWRGRQAYDSVNDELRGGWLWGAVVIAVSRTRYPRGLLVTVRLCHYWRFPPMVLR